MYPHRDPRFYVSSHRQQALELLATNDEDELENLLP